MYKWIRLFVMMYGLMVVFAAQAHQISTAYLIIEETADKVSVGQYQVKLQDLAYKINFDLDNDQLITWKEVKAQKSALVQWFNSHLIFSQDEIVCVSTGGPELLMDSHFNEPYLLLDFVINCASGQPNSLLYRGLFELNSGHKMTVNAVLNNQHLSRVLSTHNRSMTLNQYNNSSWQTFKDYTHQGVIHILIGLDHIMFLLCLLLAAVMANNHQRLSSKSVIWQVLGLVTAFTLAHSVTLVMTAMNWLSFSSRWVEVIIALTVAVTALNNIWPFIQRLVLVTFVFGLMHGMGFAGVLGELGLPAKAKLLPILAFNLGVEMGQVMLIVLIMPVLLWLQKNWQKSQTGFKAISALIVVLATYWVVERIY